MKFVSVDTPYIRREYFDRILKIPEVDSVTIPVDNPFSEEEIIERIGDAELVTSDIYPQFNKKVLDSTPNLKAIFVQAVGYDNIEVNYAKKKGVRVYNAAGFNAGAVAEFVFALVTSLMRKIPAAQAHVRAGGWEYKFFQGRELAGKTIGIVGSGNVAMRIAGIARGYNMNVISHTKNPSAKKAKALGIKSFLPLLDVMKKSDIVVLSVPLVSDTKHLVGKNELSVMKKDAILVNTSRHTVVDEFALAEAVIGGHIAGAVLDMMLSEPFSLKVQPMIIQEMVNLPNVIVTPHIGGVSLESSSHLGDIFVRNVERFMKGNLENCVNA